MPQQAPDVFVSYARADWRHAADIVSFLRAQGLTAFFDRDDLQPGLPWLRGLEKALNGTKAAIILIGPHGLGNTQQYERELAFYRQSREASFPVVPVILPEVEIGRPYNFLQILTWIDFSHFGKVLEAPAELQRLAAAVRGEQNRENPPLHTICPYRGLDAFREEDSLFFFGRGSADDPESAIGELVRKVREHPFLMVVGRSGSGKSSLVYAGLVPALRRARDRFWNVLTVRPGSEPLEALAMAFNPRTEGEGSAAYAGKIAAETDHLRKGDAELLSRMIRQELDRSEGKPDRLLLYIDQWEELYAQAPSSIGEKDRAVRHAADVDRFIELLLNASQSAPVSVLATVRADFYDPLISHHGLRAVLPAQQMVLGLMTRDDLQSTIVEPANLLGLGFDPPKLLVSQILDDTGEDEGMLPLLQYALKETWKEREGNVMTADSYARSGGVREAIRLTAERTFADLSPVDQRAARRLFLRLVTPGEGQEDTRARAAMPDEPELLKIVQHFASPQTRLLVTDRASRSEDAEQPTVEVAHEALIRRWPRLRKWIDESRDKLRHRAAILQDKAEWEGNGRRDDLLLPAGFQLERARSLLTDPGDIAVDDIKDYIAASDAADKQRRDSEQRQQQERQAAELEAARRVTRRTLAGLAVAVTLALIAIGLGVYARTQTILARAQTTEAVRQTGKAEEQKYLAEANFREAQRTESLFRAEQAQQAGSDAVTAALLALEGLPDRTASDEARRSRPFVREAWKVLFGARLQRRERAILRLRTYGTDGDGDGVASGVFAPDGRRILTVSDREAQLWDGDGHLIASLDSTARITRAILAPDGGRVLTFSDRGNPRLCDLNGDPLSTLEGHAKPVFYAAFAPDGSRILTASYDDTARLWDRNGRPLATLRTQDSPVISGVFLRDNSRILTLHSNGAARLWDGDGEFIVQFESGKPSIAGVLFSPYSNFVLVTYSSGSPRLFDRNGSQLAILDSQRKITSGSQGEITRALFAPDGGSIVTVSTDGTAELWDPSGKSIAILQGHTGSVNSAVFAPDDGSILTASSDRTARLWDHDGKPLAILQGHNGSVSSAVFASDGSRILTASQDKTARLWDRKGKLLATLQGHTGPVNGALFAPDGRRILTVSSDNTARLWDADTKPLLILDGHSGPINSAVFASDGSRILTASFDRTARVWNRDGKQLAVLRGHTGSVVSAVFAPDNDRLLTASFDNTARLWDRSGKLLAVLQGHNGQVTSAVFARDGNRILTASSNRFGSDGSPMPTSDRAARLWDGDGKLLAILDGHTDALSSATFSADGGRILTSSEDKTARLWDRDGKLIAILADPRGVTFATFAPDGNSILTISVIGITFWDRDGKILDRLDDLRSVVHSAAFSPDGNRILTDSSKGVMRLWDLHGKPIAVLEGQTGEVRSAVFASGGSRILTVSSDTTARLWDRDGKALAVLEGDAGQVRIAIFSPDGGQILTASDGNSARIWDAFPETQSLIDRAKAEMPRCLSPEQRQRLLLEAAAPGWCAAMRKWPYER